MSYWSAGGSLFLTMRDAEKALHNARITRMWWNTVIIGGADTVTYPVGVTLAFTPPVTITPEWGGDTGETATFSTITFDKDHDDDDLAITANDASLPRRLAPSTKG